MPLDALALDTAFLCELADHSVSVHLHPQFGNAWFLYD
jgi:hypothetical protein